MELGAAALGLSVEGIEARMRRELELFMTGVMARQLEVIAKLANPSEKGGTRAIAAAQRALNFLDQVVAQYKEWGQIRAELEINYRSYVSSRGPEAREYFGLRKTELQRAWAGLVHLIMPPVGSLESGVMLEIRARGGGIASALFAEKLLHMYSAFASTNNLQVEILALSSWQGRRGIRDAILRFDGAEASEFLRNEGGIHCARQHAARGVNKRLLATSVAIVVMPDAAESQLKIDLKNVEITACRGSGPGGQGVNTTDSAVRALHIPTGIEVRLQTERSQQKNRKLALKILELRVRQRAEDKNCKETGDLRRSQIGAGFRPETTRTYNFARNTVEDVRLDGAVGGLNAILGGELGRVLEPLKQQQELQCFLQILKAGIDSLLARTFEGTRR